MRQVMPIVSVERAASRVDRPHGKRAGARDEQSNGQNKGQEAN